MSLVTNNALSNQFTPDGKLIEKVPKSRRIITDGNYTYVMSTAVGLHTQTTQPIWQIMRVDESNSGSVLISYADGNTRYDNIADNYASLSYY